MWPGTSWFDCKFITSNAICSYCKLYMYYNDSWTNRLLMLQLISARFSLICYCHIVGFCTSFAHLSFQGEKEPSSVVLPEFSYFSLFMFFFLTRFEGLRAEGAISVKPRRFVICDLGLYKLNCFTIFRKKSLL